MVAKSLSLSFTGTLLLVTACATSSTPKPSGEPSPGVTPFGDVFTNVSATAPNPDPRVGLRAGMWDAAQAAWNMRLVSTTKASEKFAGITNSDLAFLGPYAIQGSYNGFQFWNISNPSQPTLKVGYLCPASQSDVSVYKNLLFVSGEGLTGRVDCGTQGVQDTVSSARLRGLRIFDISDLEHPRNVGNVQTCRGSHTHTLLVDPKDPDNVYIYISGSYIVRSPSELAGCVNANPDQDPNSAKFRLEVIKVPLAHPEQAAIVSSPRIFNNLAAPPMHGLTTQEKADLAAAKAKGAFTYTVFGEEHVISNQAVNRMLDSLVKTRGGTGAPTGADSAKLRADIQPMIDKRVAAMGGDQRTGPTQCHDITVYPQIGLAGGACEGYGFLLDIRDPAHPVRIDQVSDSNFSYWHSATFNNDGTKILFTDEWGGGGAAKCRSTDPKEWGADAIFTIVNNKLVFQSYYKLPAPQSPLVNCVAHNGSLIPIPGRDVMVQAWYQGGVSIFDWTNPKRPREIAYFDRGPMDSTHFTSGGSWSAYWYNGVIVSSEIARGLDIFELTPSPFISQNEIDAAKSVHFDEFNTQGQPRLVWPPSFALAGSYLDQLARSNGLAADKVASARQALSGAQAASGSQRRDALDKLASQLNGDADGAADPAKVRLAAGAVKDLAGSST
jgi:hypothetical protein